MLVSRPPAAALRPFVRRLWASVPDSDRTRPGAREHVLPTGTAHLAIRLDETPVRVFPGAGAEALAVGTAVLGGPRTAPYRKDTSAPGAVVGAELEPAAAGACFRVPAHELAERHTPLTDLWGDAVATMRERLAGERDLARRLLLWEQILTGHLATASIHPTVAHAVRRLSAAPREATIGGIAAETGYSTRRLLTLFRAGVGLSPSAFAQVRRFAAALSIAAPRPHRRWSAIAFAAGYSDQAHLNRDFRAFAGMSPGSYRALSPTSPHHVPGRP